MKCARKKTRLVVGQPGCGVNWGIGWVLSVESMILEFFASLRRLAVLGGSRGHKHPSPAMAQFLSVLSDCSGKGLCGFSSLSCRGLLVVALQILLIWSAVACAPLGVPSWDRLGVRVSCVLLG